MSRTLEVIIIIIFIFLIGPWLGTSIKKYQPDTICNYQRRLEKQVEGLKCRELSEYDVGWNDAIQNILNILTSD